MLELISIHLPKTAGSSFGNVLRDVFGRGLALDYGGSQSVESVRGKRAVHGHVPISKYAEHFPDAARVLWLREPIERIVSYHSFWQSTPPHGNEVHEQFLARGDSVVEFARLDAIRRELAVHLEPLGVDDFTFVGFTEDFAADLEQLATVLGWSPWPPRRSLWRRLASSYRANVARSKPTLTEGERAQLREILAQEYAIYDQAMRRKAKRLRSDNAERASDTSG